MLEAEKQIEDIKIASANGTCYNVHPIHPFGKKTINGLPHEKHKHSVNYVLGDAPFLAFFAEECLCQANDNRHAKETGITIGKMEIIKVMGISIRAVEIAQNETQDSECNPYCTIYTLSPSLLI